MTPPPITTTGLCVGIVTLGYVRALGGVGAWDWIIDVKGLAYPCPGRRRKFRRRGRRGGLFLRAGSHIR